MSRIVYKDNNEIERKIQEYYNNLGAEYPFFINDNSELIISRKIEDVIQEIPSEDRMLDLAGVIEMIDQSYLLGDRTLVNGISRSPWMGRVQESYGWEYSKIPSHSNIIMGYEEAAKKLKKLLRNELMKYIDKKQTVGILLSGGLDSRVVAGILRELQLSNDFNGTVVAFTWGIETSRDVIYAREICRKYEWDWIPIDLNSQVLKENIEVAARLGAEFSPLHLHGMQQIRNTAGVDVIIAGSYGDSVGRAEYSGKHILKLDDILPQKINKFGLLKNDIIKKFYSNVVDDAYGYKKYIIREKPYQYREIEQELHYMRRKLQACMNFISEKIPLYQLFTDQETFGFMWSLDPSIRNDKIYEIILKGFSSEIGSIPWARTGKSIDGLNIDTNKTSKSHHRYGIWLRQDLNEYVKELVLSDEILNLQIFNERSLVKLVKVWESTSTITTNQIDEVISWLASLSIFLSLYDVKNSFMSRDSIKDKVNSIYGSSYAKIYQLVREKRRN